MALTGLAAGDIALEGARRIVDKHARMMLQGADRDAFLAAISPEPTPRLVEAFKRHISQFG
jgi:uncharacterized protein (DUF1778 family)